MPSDEGFSEEKIQKMLEESRMKTVPPQVLKGFKEDVMRRIASAPAPEAKPAVKPGRWIASGWKLPRVGLSVGVGAFACLMIASLAVLTTDLRQPAVKAPAPVQNGSFQVASIPAVPPVPASAASAVTSSSSRAFDMMSAPAAQAKVPAAVRKTALTVEEELRLIEEFDDRRFFIRQDITEDELASA